MSGGRILGGRQFIATSKQILKACSVEMAQDNTMIGGIGNKSVIMKSLDLVFDKFALIIPEKLANVKRMEKQ